MAINKGFEARLTESCQQSSQHATDVVKYRKINEETSCNSKDIAFRQRKLRSPKTWQRVTEPR